MPGVCVRLTGAIPKDYTDHPTTLAEHLKCARRTRKLLQRDVAQLIGVDAATVANWENGKTIPPIGSYPGVIRFLGYDPNPVPTTLPERMLGYRRQRGLSVKEAALQLGVDEGSWGALESVRVVPWKRFVRQLETFLET